MQTQFHEEFDRKKKLKKAAKEVLLTERARDKALEKENAKQLGLEDSTVSNPASPGLKRD